ncbi:FAD-dependent oxidoreductase [Lactobacillus sp. LC28-10]|uniref:FAD-dependent oxidoreductase n=1 Tax=Secundilactobacillus angelensis TaxID=2722706 RepID=A0ABX1KWR2_9LACO|nr:FAD-dependent oxidoreductase [Secundilactobacillus angelensis]MCH5461975.1 FAD-dependent oxidoreductase [Secundilactobacillus angelensis]NLR17463.1 FAD-dependent oxidoreductase [Secundilactobacillus angelensis]
MKVIVIGGIAGGPSFATRFRRLNEQNEIVILERGEYISIASCALPYYLGGVITDRDSLIERTPAVLKQKNNIDVRVHHEVTAIDPKRHVINVTNLDADEQYQESYDKLVLATGARPVLPPIKGIETATNVFTLRSLADGDRIKNYLQSENPKRVTILGAGAAGIELSENLRRIGMTVTLVDQADRVMQPYDGELTDFLQEELVNNGVDVRLGETIDLVEENGHELHLSDGSVLTTDMLLVVVGVTPNSELAGNAGLQLSPDGHIIVDDQLATSATDIYAIGDVIETTSRITGLPVASMLSSAANRQGHLLADILNGEPLRYPGFVGVSVAKVFNLTASMVGYSEQTLQAAGVTNYDSLFITPFDHAYFYPNAKRLNIKVLYEPDTGRILGGQFVGENGVDKRAGELSAAIAGGLTIDDLPSIELPYSPPFSAPRDPLNLAGYVGINQRQQANQTVRYRDLTEPEKWAGTFLDIHEAGKPVSSKIDSDLAIPLTELRDRLNEVPTGHTVYILYRKGLGPYNASRILAGNGYDVKIVTDD